MANEQISPIQAFSYLAFVAIILATLSLTNEDIVSVSEDHPKPVVFISSTNALDSGISRRKDSTILINTTQQDTVTLSTNIMPTFIDSLLEAATHWKDRNRKCPVVRYYVKPLDANGVFDLHRYGYYVHVRPSNGLDNYHSNTIRFGDSVASEDIVLVASHMIRSGFPLKSVSLSKYHDDWKSKALEIGTDTTLLSHQTLTIQDLEEMFVLH